MSAIHTTKLGCGATLAVESIDGVESAAVSFLIPCGDAHDPHDRRGRAAMWSELLLRGAGDLTSRQLADAFDRLGASKGVSNGKRFVRLSATTLGKHAADAAALLAGMILRPRFDAEAVEPARDLCLQALAGLADEPQQRAAVAATERHHPEPLNRSQFGTEAGLRALSRDELAGGWSNAAKPGGTIIGVAGSVDADAFATALDRMLGDWSGEGAPIKPTGEASRGYAHAQDDSEQVQILIAHDAPQEDHEHAVHERLVTAVLSGGMSGRLFTEVREKRGLCYSVNASYGADVDRGTVTAYVGTTPQRAQESLDVLHAELERMTGPKAEITPAEFDRAVTGLKSRLVFSGESTAARAAAIATDIARLGRPRTLAEFAGEVDRVTLDDLNTYARSRSLGRMTIQSLGPAALTPPA